MTEPMLPVLTEKKPDDPTLLVTLAATPPVVDPKARYIRREDWTLDLLERTVFEFRAAGGFDASKVNLEYRDGGTLECEIMVGRKYDAMPWGYRPLSHPEPLDDLQPAEPDVVKEDTWSPLVKMWQPLGNRYVQGVLLVLLMVLVVLK